MRESTLPGTLFVGTVFVQGRGLDDTTLTVQAPGYSNATSAITVQPSGVVLASVQPPNQFALSRLFGPCDFTTTTSSGDTVLSVIPAMLDPTFLNFQSEQAVRGGLTVSVPVTSATPAVGTIVGSPAVFSATVSTSSQPALPSSHTLPRIGI